MNGYRGRVIIKEANTNIRAAVSGGLLLARCGAPVPLGRNGKVETGGTRSLGRVSDLFLTSQCSFPNGHSRREGLGLDDRRARRHARPPRLGRFRRPGLLPSDLLLVDG